MSEPYSMFESAKHFQLKNNKDASNYRSFLKLFKVCRIIGIKLCRIPGKSYCIILSPFKSVLTNEFTEEGSAI